MRHRRISQGDIGVVKRMAPSMMISVSVSGFICLALAAGIFIPARGSVFGSIPFALAAGVFITFMVLVLGFIPLTLAAGVFIAFMVLVSALSAGNLKAIRTKLFETKLSLSARSAALVSRPSLLCIPGNGWLVPKQRREKTACWLHGMVMVM